MAIRVIQGVVSQATPDQFVAKYLELNDAMAIQIISIDMFVDANSIAIWQAASFHTLEISLSTGNEPMFITSSYDDSETRWVFEYGVKSGDHVNIPPIVDRGYIPPLKAGHFWLAMHTQFTNVTNRLNYKIVYDEMELTEIQKIALGFS